MELCTAAGNIQIKQDTDKKFYLFIDGSQVDSRMEYAPIAKLATEIHVAKLATKDPLVGKQVFASAAIGADSPLVVVIAKVSNGYLVQRVGTDQRFTVLADLLSEVPTSLFK